MDINKDNVNPTILNPSDLPSRRRESTAKRRDHGGAGMGLFDTLIPHHSYLSDPFDDSASEGSLDDDVMETIDEQEIYGTSLPSGTLAPLIHHANRPYFHHLRP